MSSPARRDAAAPRDASSPPPAEATRAVGTAHPVTVEAAAADGSWVVLCQARADTDGDGTIDVRVGPHGTLEGDAMAHYLVVGEGAGEQIDEWVASDARGRLAVLVRGGRLVLREMPAGRETDLTALGADSRDDRASFAGHRAASFDADGRRLLYLRRAGSRDVAVVRDLSTSRETVIDPGPVELWRAAFGPAGESVVLRVIGDDTNGNGRLDWPAPPARRARGCHGPRPPYASWLGHGDTVTTRVARATGGPARSRPGLVTPFGRAVVVRERSERLVLDGPEGRREIAPASCHARVLHADPRRGLLVTTCGDPKAGPVGVQLLATGSARELGIAVAPPGTDVLRPAGPRLLPLYPGADSVLLDLERRSLDRLSPGDVVVATRAERALVRRGLGLILHSAASGSRSLPGRVDELPDVVRSPGNDAVVVVPLVVSLAHGRLLGAVRGRPLAVSATGRVLVALGAEGDADRLPSGPLAWRTPEP